MRLMTRFAGLGTLVRLALVMTGFLVTGPATAQSETSRLVLVVSSNSPIVALAPSEVRRLFLGVPHEVAGRGISPLRYTQAQTQEVFLQKVMFMSLQAYERQIVSQTFRSGHTRPFETTDLASLTESLLANPMAVSYLPESDALKAPGLKIIGDLGHVGS